MKTTIHFEAPVGQRILRNRFMGVTTFSLESEDKYHSLWWDGKQWSEEAPCNASSHAPVRSYKAFLRHLKKHQEQLRGYEVILVSRYKGYNITATIA